MTREEAVSKAINIVRYFEAHFAKSKEAREDAANIIEALEQESCADMVSRDAMWEVLQRLYGTEGELVEELMSLPPVLPMPKMGMWIEHFDESGKWYECDQCHTDWGGSVNYCPNCGSYNGGEG